MYIFSYLMESWMIGFAIAAILGPIGILCIRKTLELGFLGGISVGLGAALADGGYTVLSQEHGLSSFRIFCWKKILS